MAGGTTPQGVAVTVARLPALLWTPGPRSLSGRKISSMLGLGEGKTSRRRAQGKRMPAAERPRASMRFNETPPPSVQVHNIHFSIGSENPRVGKHALLAALAEAGGQRMHV